jgi:O-antigen/teichoic acid export membrane protein
LAAIKQLAGQTLWYGVSNIGAKFLNYLLTPLITYLLKDDSGVKEYGDYSLMYVWIAVLNIIFTYGFETGYFRFSNRDSTDRKSLFQTTFGSLVISTVGLVFLFSLFRVPINNFLGLDGHPEYITWALCLIGFDALAAIPFAKLRQENRPKKYAFIKIAGIMVNITAVVFFLVYMPQLAIRNPTGWLASWTSDNNRVGFLLMANLLQTIFVFLMLFPEWKVFRFKIDAGLWKKIFAYSAPMIIIGLAGMINEVMDRQMLAKFLPMSADDAKKMVGIYSANYKLAIFITLFIQAFKMAAEPFFFNQANDKNAPHTYARVMKWFVIVLALAFLSTALYLDILKYWINHAYHSGLGVVPILLFANICLGIYYNLSVWYKLTDRMNMGLYITLAGAVITLIGNYYFIPVYGMYASAWSTLVCYLSMTVLAYLLGQKYFPVPYPVKKILAYLAVMLILFFVKKGVDFATASLSMWPMLIIRVLAATGLMLLFLRLIMKAESKELKTMPFVGRFIK